MAAERRGEASWSGDLTEGSGTVSLASSGAASVLQVTWASRTEDHRGKTSPEELIAAAHAACFSMALSNGLGKQGTPPERLAVSAAVTFVPGSGITASALNVEAVVPGLDESAFQKAAEDARDNCPVSAALRGNVDLSVTARLTGS